MSDETATTSEPGPAAAEFERVQAEDAAIGWEIQTLLAEGRELRKNGATNADLADINAKLEDLYCQRPAPSYLDWLERAAENEKHGWTTLADGSVAKVQPKVLSVHGGLSEFTDSDGTVYKQTPEDQRRRAEDHKAVALAFQAQVTDERLTRIRRAQASGHASIPRRTPQARSPRPAARRAAGVRSGCDPGDDGESSEPPPRRLCAFCGKDIPADRSPRALYCSDRHADRARQRRKRQRDRARARLSRIPTTADFRRMLELDADDLAALVGRSTCSCNGHHLEFDPGECFRCGHWLPKAGWSA